MSAIDGKVDIRAAYTVFATDLERRNDGAWAMNSNLRIKYQHKVSKEQDQMDSAL